ncbi:hypothetical protein [Neobacillus sp. PS3-40]|uniref:hypothetical protein n=1 Tax=Neobacillus sp. PS3-40 TaxID=3070679 RepID=UPI0027DF1B27|nr:hypothetical protein [Neobacillus sp. PS3-40]WML42898.1 hypothetical protein RCG20_13775 [Neobacillus sp. PS3-40]
MEKEQAIFLSQCIDESIPSTYEINKLDTKSGTLPRFHQWTNGKPVIAGYKVTKLDSETSYYLIFIDWHRNDNYYLVVYSHDKSTTFAEIRQIEELENGLHLVWKYIPLKRDGKNDQRKSYFKQTFGSTTIQIMIPQSKLQVETFFDQLFRLCQNRVKADKIVDVFDFDKRNTKGVLK